jgi:transcriptional regulator with XRE-family HTH domain
MGRYRLGDIIRMTRKSLSITQEQLSDEICSVETLSRIENGNQNPSRDVYELLMGRMGRFRDRAYSVLSVSDFKVLEKMKLFEDCIKLFDFNQAGIVLREIKDTLGNSTLDKQFMLRAESLVNYRLKRINTQEFLQEFEKALLLTIPKYGSISLSNWPLSFNEAMLLVNISSAYYESGDCLKAIKETEEAYTAMKQSYMEEQQRAILQITMASNLSKWYGLIKNHEKAIAIAEEGVSLCKKFRLGNALPNLLYGIAWNKEYLIEMGVLPPESRRECLAYFKKSYYIALAMQMPYLAQLIGDHITSNYNLIL